MTRRFGRRSPWEAASKKSCALFCVWNCRREHFFSTARCAHGPMTTAVRQTEVKVFRDHTATGAVGFSASPGTGRPCDSVSKKSDVSSIPSPRSQASSYWRAKQSSRQHCVPCVTLQGLNVMSGMTLRGPSYPHTKFEVTNFTHSRYIERATENYKSRSRDVGHAPFLSTFAFFGL